MTIERNFKKECNKCGRIITGVNERQVDSLIRTHQLGKYCEKPNKKQKLFKKKCNICGKVIVSLSEGQCNYNFLAHREACIIKTKNKVNEDGNRK